MIESVTIINDLGESLVLELSKPGSSGFEVRDVKGLGPPKATINMTKVSTVDGVMYVSSTVEGRNIVLKLGFTSIPSVEENRLKSYQYFPLKRPVTVIVKSDKRTAGTYGYVESNEPVIWGTEKETQISIVCPDSYLFDATEDNTIGMSFYSVEPEFEFPFSNESTTFNMIELSKLTSTLSKEVFYTGETPVGLTIKINAVGPVVNPVVYNPTTNEAIRIDTTILAAMTGSGIIAGDQITIKTGKGEKSATLIRAGVPFNILNTLGRNVDWMQFAPGGNVIAYTATSGVENLQIDVSSLILYEGV